MTGFLLGVKFIAWLYIISGIGTFIRFIIGGKIYIIDTAIVVLIGINLLRRKDLARKSAIFFAYATIIFVLVFSVITPLMIMKVNKDYGPEYTQYQDKQNQLKALIARKAPAIEVNKLKEELAVTPPDYESYKKINSPLESLEERTHLDMFNIIFLCWQLFIIYYLKKEYVRKRFERG